MTPNERHKQDASIQYAALMHYAQKCRYAAQDGGSAIATPEQLEAWAERADTLANVYMRLANSAA